MYVLLSNLGNYLQSVFVSDGCVIYTIEFCRIDCYDHMKPDTVYGGFFEKT